MIDTTRKDTKATARVCRHEPIVVGLDSRYGKMVNDGYEEDRRRRADTPPSARLVIGMKEDSTTAIVDCVLCSDHRSFASPRSKLIISPPPVGSLRTVSTLNKHGEKSPADE